MKRWPTKPLGELVLPTEQRDPRENPTEEFSYVDIAGIDNEAKTIAAIKRVVGAEAPSRARKVIRGGDVIVSTVRPNLNAVALVPDTLENQICSTGFSVLRPSERVLSGYLFAFARSPSFIDYLVARTTGANYPAVDDGEVKEVPVPIPPLAEQERIVKLLDEADALRKLRAQADRRTAALLPALFHEMFGRHLKIPPVLVSLLGTAVPKGWRWSLLTDVARFATGHTPSRRHPEYWGGEIPWISLTDIRMLDGTIATTTSECVTEDGIENSSSVKLPQGTVCFSRTASVGFVTVMGREMATSQDFVNWVCGDELDPIYLMSALMQAREHLRSLASGSTHKTIYFPTVEQFCVPVPPLPLQKEFAQQVTEIRALEAAQAASRRRLEDLFQSMLHRAFNGEL